MKFTTLIENLVYDRNLIGEHGFSILIETGKNRVIFDTGQTGNFIHNAIASKIKLSQIDCVVISHGHYDHTGGLMEFTKFNDTAKIYLKEQCFQEKYKSENQYIGIPFNRSYFENRLEFTDDIVEIMENIFVFPRIKLHYDYDTHFNNMYIKEDKGFILDEFNDEQFLAVKKKDSVIIISGCSHRGITNVVQTAVEYFNLPVELILGGFHFKNETDENTERIIDILNKFGINNIGVAHCTGMEKYNLMKKKMNCNVFYNFTGKIINL